MRPPSVPAALRRQENGDYILCSRRYFVTTPLISDALAAALFRYLAHGHLFTQLWNAPSSAVVCLQALRQSFSLQALAGFEARARPKNTEKLRSIA
jgi:hypothetical protein